MIIIRIGIDLAKNSLPCMVLMKTGAQHWLSRALRVITFDSALYRLSSPMVKRQWF